MAIFVIAGKPVSTSGVRAAQMGKVFDPRDFAGSTIGARFNAAINEAKLPANQWYLPDTPWDHEFPSWGPQEPMGWVHLSFSDLSAIYAGSPTSLTQTNHFLHTGGMIEIPSHVLVTIEDGVWIDLDNNTMFVMGNKGAAVCEHGGLLGLNQGNRGTGWQRGNPCINGDLSLTYGTNDTTLASATMRTALVRAATNVVVGDQWCRQNRRQIAGNADHAHQSECPHIAFKGPTLPLGPRRMVYRNHYCFNAPAGFGPNQFATMSDSVIRNMFSNGGIACRFEPDTGEEAGLHNSFIRQVYSEFGNRAMNLSPHAQDLINLDIRGVYSNSSWELIKFSNTGAAQGGVMQGINVVGGCAFSSGGLQAQNPYPSGQWTQGAKPNQCITEEANPAANDWQYAQVYHSPNAAAFGLTGEPGIRSNGVNAGACSLVVVENIRDGSEVETQMITPKHFVAGQDVVPGANVSRGSAPLFIAPLNIVSGEDVPGATPSSAGSGIVLVPKGPIQSQGSRPGATPRGVGVATLLAGRCGDVESQPGGPSSVGDIVIEPTIETDTSISYVVHL